MVLKALTDSVRLQLLILLVVVGAHGPAIFTLVPLVLIATAMLAAMIPARRATLVDPVRALTQE